MDEPVDLTNLREITDGDAKIEAALFKEFLSSFETGFKSLQESAGDAEAWRKSAHALKGISLNLGAHKLGALCKQGQDEPQAGADAKNVLMKNIEAEYALVKAYLQKIISSS